ncbi:MAG: hypothetical protein AAF399_08325 [Bacteroidota bacterium]
MNPDPIRKLIAHNKMTEAFRQLQAELPEAFLAEGQALQAQFHQWEKAHRLNLGPAQGERNRITYATLLLVSRAYKATQAGNLSRKDEGLLQLESQVVMGLEKSAVLRQNNFLDLFLLWMDQQHTARFQAIVLAELHQDYQRFAQTLQTLPLASFLHQHQLEVSEEETRAYLLHKQRETPNLLTHWQAYQQYRSRYANDLDRGVQICQKRHQRLLGAGIIGGVLGALGTTVLTRGLDEVVAFHEGGHATDEQPSFFDGSDDEDDFDDDDE